MCVICDTHRSIVLLLFCFDFRLSKSPFSHIFESHTDLAIHLTLSTRQRLHALQGKGDWDRYSIPIIKTGGGVEACRVLHLCPRSVLPSPDLK